MSKYRLPKGYGSITKLSGKRNRPYCVRPPSEKENGVWVKQKPICYTDTWHHGFAVLTAWKAGTYTPGMEKELELSPEMTQAEIVKRIIRDYNTFTNRQGLTFAEVWEIALKWYTDHRELSEHSRRAYEYAFQRLSTLHEMPFPSISTLDYQNAVDEASQRSMAMQMKSVISICYKYGISCGMCSTNLSSGIVIKNSEVKHGTPFSEKEIKFLWEHKDDSPYYVDALIMIYSGFRRSAYQTMEVNLKEMYFKGGVKTKQSKGRIVPIHSCIQGLVRKYGVSRIGSVANYHTRFSQAMARIGMEHSPHDCRHTFSALCEKYDVRENDRKRLLGHAIGDITNDVYGHRTVEELRKEIEKICCPIVVLF